jgi:hypothetical protein
MGPAGRRLHIAHRRSPSELTPLMSSYFHTFTTDLADTFVQWNNLLLHSKLRSYNSSNSRLPPRISSM